MNIDEPALRAFVARVFPGTVDNVERVRSGASTPVYRVRSMTGIFYVRLAETPEASLAPEARVHVLLRERGVRLPEVVFLEPFDEALGRSVLVTTEIPGEPVAVREVDATTHRIVRDAGRDLAIINQLSIQGYGWIDRRHGGDALQAEYTERRAWAAGYVDAVELLVRTRRLAGRAARRAQAAVESWATLSTGERSCIAHGDFDVTHIFQLAGRYSGVIDFGEIRGTDRWYDLGHFHLHDGETLAGFVLPDLLVGYHEVQPSPEDLLARIDLEAVAIGLAALARTVGRTESAHAIWLNWRVHQLLDRLSLQ